MQIKLFTIPIHGGEQLCEAMNRFLRSKKILQTESRLVSTVEGSFWCFCIRYLAENQQTDKRRKIDYRAVLDSGSFQRFAAMREIRKKLAQQEGIPAYAVFTDAELAELARIEHLTLADLRGVHGIGAAKVEKYGAHFTAQENNETGKPTA
ncbi:MAG: HRDC domain-containing protein [Candidatus Electrothrix sp. GW3-4]|uniref:HRDC domain-containing protein n=1 Tax=Candidatus Electrothrix sp. GW3-4 TaxID=3126740 RepID=UPI0030D0577A